jgi:hypothetical protein
VENETEEKICSLIAEGDKRRMVELNLILNEMFKEEEGGTPK